MAVTEAQIIAAIEKYCNIKLTSTSTTQYFDGGYGMTDLVVKIGPMISITSITDMDATTGGSALTSTLYDFDPDMGSIYNVDGSSWGASKSRRRWKVIYAAGYTSTPADIQMAIDMWEDYLTDNPSGVVASYKTGDDSETYNGNLLRDIPEPVKAILRPYVRRVFWH